MGVWLRRPCRSSKEPLRLGSRCRISKRDGAARPRGGSVPPHGRIILPRGKAIPPHGSTILPHREIIPPRARVILPHGVLVGWGWQGFSAFLDMLEIQVDRGDGKGFVFLTYDTTPNYTDTFPLPATPTKWKYRAIYRVGDAQVGVWSNMVEITVGG